MNKIIHEPMMDPPANSAWLTKLRKAEEFSEGVRLCAYIEWWVFMSRVTANQLSRHRL